MTDSSTSSVDSFYDEINDSALSETETLSVAGSSNRVVDSRRRLEEKLEQRYLEKDVQEFIFDF